MVNVRGQFWPCGPKKCVGSRGRAELLGKGTSALLLVHRDADSRFEDFAWETATSLKKRGRREEGAGF